MAPPKLRAPWSRADRATLRDMRAMGARTCEIAAALGRTHESVKAKIRKGGYARSPRVRVKALSNVPTCLHPGDPGLPDPTPKRIVKTRRERDIEAVRKHLRDLVRGYPNTARRLVAIAHTHVHAREATI